MHLHSTMLVATSTLALSPPHRSSCCTPASPSGHSFLSYLIIIIYICVYIDVWVSICMNEYEYEYENALQ